MPKYDYKCPKCSRIEEVEHAMSETPEVECAHCHVRARKIFTPTPSVFRGGGWGKMTEYKPKKNL